MRGVYEGTITGITKSIVIVDLLFGSKKRNDVANPNTLRDDDDDDDDVLNGNGDAADSRLFLAMVQSGQIRWYISHGHITTISFPSSLTTDSRGNRSLL
jgi:hypothetical protein